MKLKEVNIHKFHLRQSLLHRLDSNPGRDANHYAIQPYNLLLDVSQNNVKHRVTSQFQKMKFPD